MPKKLTASHIANKVKKLRKKKTDVTVIFDKLSSGDKTALAQAITLIESTRDNDFEPSEKLINKCLGVTSDGVRIGITGVPGVGKSTFIEALGTFLTRMGKKVAVLAVDPSSSFTKGSIF